MSDAEEVDRHTALLDSRRGRWFAAVTVSLVAGWVVGPNIPASPLRDQVDAVWRPAVVVGLDQSWGVFSPNPRTQSLDVRARITHADDSVEFWDVPRLDPSIGALREYRWQKWQERIRLDDSEDRWDSTAEWIASQHVRNGSLPIRVELIRRWIDHEPLTAGGLDDSGWNEFRYHVWERES